LLVAFFSLRYWDAIFKGDTGFSHPPCCAMLKVLHSSVVAEQMGNNKPGCDVVEDFRLLTFGMLCLIQPPTGLKVQTLFVVWFHARLVGKLNSGPKMET